MFFSAVLILVRLVTVCAMNTTNMFSFGSIQNVVPPALYEFEKERILDPLGKSWMKRN